MYATFKGFPLYFKSIIVSNILYYVFMVTGGLLYSGYSPLTFTVSSIGNTEKNPNGWFLFSLFHRLF